MKIDIFDDIEDTAKNLAKQSGEARALSAQAIADLSNADVRVLACALLTEAVRHARRTIARQVEDAASRVTRQEEWDGWVTQHNERAALSIAFSEHMQEVGRALARGEISLDAARAEAKSGHLAKNGGTPGYLTVDVTATIDGVTRKNWVSLNGYDDYDLPRLRKAQRQVESDAKHDAEVHRARVAFGLPAESTGWTDDLLVYMDKLRVKARLNLTAELLASPFAVGGGREVSWGEATAEDHGFRVNAQLQHAAGTLDDVERHRAAIAILRAADAKNLNAVAGQ